MRLYIYRDDRARVVNVCLSYVFFKKKTNLQSSVVHFDNGLVSLG